MAQKATKTLATRNTSRLNTTHLLTLSIHLFYWLLRFLLYPRSFTSKSLALYILFSGPSLLITLYFERLSRPTYTSSGSVQRAGEDLDAPGLTEYMWDVTYWTWGCVVLAAVLGDWAWWAWGVIPVYAGWLAWGTYSGMRGGFAEDAAGVPQQAGSKRAAKMEKRGQKVQYR
ncbi:hypothetical protein K491DRAFT_701673 [Lophiostoma macrostomum CBS 122681]|uniref:DUF788-domain-containing protein n=1 Tax=Lophiostoma macrostomum CBS 122681 TaxID=1314788 RepID=A0A6A6TJT4_9PLEO|nr:hypothetical protein K491DRAFT_701673 [Lophiostoma macrostomum CBS 122681]